LKFRETVAVLLLLFLGLVPRLLFVSSFPTIPIADFHNLVAFGVALRDRGIISSGHLWFWDFFNPGFSLILCGIFHLVPYSDPDTVARVATAIASGLMPLVPFLIWRGVLPFWVRLTAGIALAMWPGQILFSGVASQDNWIIFPALILGALAVRSLMSKERPHLLSAALLYGAAVAIRQEAVMVLLPLFLAVVRPQLRATWQRWMAIVLAAVLPLTALAAYRYLCTGRFALTTRHGGLTILGSHIPGAASGWIQPSPYIASVRPDLLGNSEAQFSEASRLAFDEIRRRPFYHAVRDVSLAGHIILNAEGASLPWSLGQPEVLPPALCARGAALAERLVRPLRVEFEAIGILFLAAIVVGIGRKNWAILVLATVPLLNLAVHAVTNPEGRFLFVGTALELLAIVLATFELRTMARKPRLFLAARSLAIGTAVMFVVFYFTPRLQAWTRSHDVVPQRGYHFVLETPGHDATMTCEMHHGFLSALTGSASVTVRTMHIDPPPGESATAECEVTGSGKPGSLVVQVLDPYARGGFPDRMMQRVEVDGVEVFAHDIAKEPGSGWADIPLNKRGAGDKHRVIVEVKAIRPDIGPAWGAAAETQFRLKRTE
jgi:hypothetical protein